MKQIAGTYERNSRRRSHRLLLLLGLFLLPGGSLAEPSRSPTPLAPTPDWDLQRCVETALSLDPDLEAAAADLALARARLQEAEAARWGDVSLRQIVGVVPEARGDLLDPPTENRNQVLRNLGPFTQLELGIHLPLWTFGKLRSALEAAEHGLAASRAGGAARRADTVLQVKRLYYGVLLGDQLADLLREMLDTLDQAVRKTKGRLDAGSSSVTEIDLLKLQAGRARFAAGVAEVEKSSILARSALARTVGLTDPAALELAENRLQAVPVQISPVEEYLEAGPERRPEWQQASAGVAAAAAVVEREQARLYPDVFLGTGFQYGVAPNRTRQRNPFAWESFNYERPVGVVGFHWDLNVSRHLARIEAARAERGGAEARQRQLERGLDLEIRSAHAEVTRASTAMEAGQAGRRAGRALLVLTVSNFDLGIGEAEELFKALGLYTEASSEHLRAVHDFNVAIGSLGRAVGEDLTGLTW